MHVINLVHTRTAANPETKRETERHEEVMTTFYCRLLDRSIQTRVALLIIFC